MMSKPAIVLVPGACLSTTVFSSFLPYLQKLGYSTLTLQLASANPQGDPHLASAVSDAADLRKDIVSILESDGGRDIIVVLHSYAGIPGGGAVKGLSKSIRAEEGKKGGIVGVVWLAALLLPEGKDVASWLEGGKGWEGNKINFVSCISSLGAFLLYFFFSPIPSIFNANSCFIFPTFLNSGALLYSNRKMSPKPSQTPQDHMLPPLPAIYAQSLAAHTHGTAAKTRPNEPKPRPRPSRPVQ